MTEGIPLGELAKEVGGRVLGDPGKRIRGVAPLETAGPDQLSLLTQPRYRKEAESSRAGALLVRAGTGPPDRDLLEVAEPYLALAEILEIFHPPRPRRAGVHPDARLGCDVRTGEGVEVGPYAVVGDGVSLGARCIVGAGCVVGADCSIGEDSVLMPRAVAYPGTEIGARCLIHSGVVLGGDGFGFATSRGRHRKIPQVGRVVVENDVEIGANSTVDRGALGDTVIGEGTKIDDLVMVAHGVRVGAHCLLVAQSGVAGSARVGDRVTLAGQSGIAGHLEIGRDCVVAAKTAVLQDLPPGSVVSGIPAFEHASWKRVQALVRRLPELQSEIRRLKKRLDALEDRPE